MEQVIGLVVAVLLGALIGLERQLRGHPAGLHANALVALGAAAYVIAGMLIGDDPTGPVGFVCAGLIWHQGGSVRGINTAVTVWCSCAVGVLAGSGLLAWALLVAVLVVFTNVVLHVLERRIGA